MGAASSKSNNKPSEQDSVKIIQNIQESLAEKKQEKLNSEAGAQDSNSNSQNTPQQTFSREHDALWKKIDGNDVKGVKKYLDNNEVQENHVYDSNGDTMIHRGVAMGQKESIMLLLERTGAKPDLVNNQLETPLHVASKNDKIEISKFLIGCGVDANCQDEHGQTPLILCCIYENCELALNLVEASISGHLSEPLEVNLPDHFGLTPLIYAAMKGNELMVRLLVTRGNANTNLSNPKGCTPLMYAGRGGYSECVRFLLEKKASALKQDNSGCTVLHHAIKKGHTQVLETMLQHGVDIYSAIEIADNAGRTPLFEACQNMLEDYDSTQAVEIIKILTRKKQENGFGALVNVLNYTGQTPLFQAASKGNLGAVKVLIEAGAHPDLNNGEKVKLQDQESIKNDGEATDQMLLFQEALNQCMTPLHVSAILGNLKISLYLIENGANVNLQSNRDRYSAMHLAVLSNNPDLIMELLKQTTANPLLEDGKGHTLLDMVYKYIPDSLEQVQSCLENLDQNRLIEDNEKNQNNVNADDERTIQGIQNQQKIQEMYAKEEPTVELTRAQTINLDDLDETDLQIEGEMNSSVESLYGRRVALCLIATNWLYKEQALKVVLKNTDKMLTHPENDSSNPSSLSEIVNGSLAAVACTCSEKVIKVFSPSLQLFNTITQSSRVANDFALMTRVIRCVKSHQIIERLLTKSEESNTRQTNKIHEALLDFSYLEQVGPDIVSLAVLDYIVRYNSKASINNKGILSQLALLYKLVNSFSIDQAPHSVAALSLTNILGAVLPACSHSRDDIRLAALKILIDLHRLTGAIKEEHLLPLPEKVRESIWAKLQTVQSEVYGLNKKQKGQRKDPSPRSTLYAPVSNEPQKQFGAEDFERSKVVIFEKGSHRDWQYREQAFLAMQDYFRQISLKLILSDFRFIQHCSQLLVHALEDNNIQIYLVAIEVAQIFLEKTISSDAILDALPSILRAAIVHSTDTNTRVRKRSIELVKQVWESQLHNSSEENPPQLIAGILTDASLNEKAIIGRLGLFIKKALLIESGAELNTKPMHLIMGKDYEQLIEFACQWCMHKNTKVRQGALKLIIEVCRLNHIDPRGDPFKQRIVNFILGLRPSLRDPLVAKINEVCLQESKASDTSAQAEFFINENEMELSIATKHRARSYDVRRNLGNTFTEMRQTNHGKLPQIGGGALPGIGSKSPTGGSYQNQPTIVLPHSEPLSDEHKKANQQLIDLFGLKIVTCLFSQTWSSRQAAILKVEEQILNLDPNQRDAMYGEINRTNMAPEVSFQAFVRFADEGIRDPVLKNYIAMLELIQKALPVYFTHLRSTQIKHEMMPLVKTIVQKTKDLKQKVREASVNFCLYLSHQNQIGTETMVNQILNDLETSYSSEQQRDVQSVFGNSHLIASCLKLLEQYQQQSKVVKADTKIYLRYANNINCSLKHQNPQVRRAAEMLFKQMYSDFGEDFIEMLKDQKPQLQQKLVAEARAEIQVESKTNFNSTRNKLTRQRSQEDNDSLNAQRQVQVRDDYLSQPQILAFLKGNEDKIRLLKMPNPKKRVQGIIELKKIIQLKFNSLGHQQMTDAIKDLIEPFSILLRHLLHDDNSEVYLESLNLLKFIVSSMAPHMTQLDQHLMMSSFIGVILSSNSQTRMRVASDKIIIYFAKHVNIGSFVVAKEICKNIERLNKLAFQAPFVAPKDTDEDKKTTLARLYSILQMLIQQFSIVLCYQPDFYKKMLETVADTLAKCSEYSVLKTVSTQLIVTLFTIDPSLLDERVQQLDFTKKANIRKIIIELQNSQDRGNQLLFTQSQTLVGGERQNSPNQSFRDTQQSFVSHQTGGQFISPTVGRRKGSQQVQGQEMDLVSQGDRNFELNRFRLGQQQSRDNNQNQLQLRLQQTNQSNRTNSNWNGTNLSQNGTSLPDVNDRGGRMNQHGSMGSGMVSGKAAGFKSNLNAPGNYSYNQEGSQSHRFVESSGIAPGMAAHFLSQESPGNPFDNPSGSAQGSGLKRIRLQQALADTSIEPGAPPLYIPQKRSESGDRYQESNEAYQPTMLSRDSRPSVAPQVSPTARVLLGSPILRMKSGMDSAERRYRVDPQDQAQIRAPVSRRQDNNQHM